MAIQCSGSVVWRAVRIWYSSCRHGRARLLLWLLCLLPFVSPAQDFTYTIANGEARITGYTGPGGDVIIPSTLEGVPVTGIGVRAFEKCLTLTSVKIPESVFSIEFYAFQGCKNLTRVDFSEGLYVIFNYAFAFCERLVEVDIPDSVVIITSMAFQGCRGLTNVTIGHGLQSLYSSVFIWCPNLKAVCFHGNAPTATWDLFLNTNAVTVYRKESATGWPEVGASWYARPTALWDPTAPLATPVFDQESGLYHGESVSVTVTCGTPEATIRYTIDGSEPTVLSHMVDNGDVVVVPVPGVLKAMAHRAGAEPSGVQAAEYTAASFVATPVVNPDGGEYPGESMPVAVTCETPGAAIHYTTDGSEPTMQSATVEHGGTVTVPFPGILKAAAFKAGLDPSGVRTSVFTAAPAAAKPVFDPDGGDQLGGQVMVSIHCETAGAAIHYTTDGSEPTMQSATVETGSTVSVPIPGVLKAVAFKEGIHPSGVRTAVYTAAPTVASPMISPAGGATPGESVTVTVTCETPEATIHYTIDGSEPTEQSATMGNGGTVVVPIPGVLKTIAHKAGMNPSGVRTAEFTVAPTVATPTLSHNSGVYTGQSLSVIIMNMTAKSTIYYTIDGTEPTEQTGMVYGGRFSVPLPAVLKAVAFREGWNPSGVVTAEYIAAPVVATPTFDPEGGAHPGGSVRVRVSCETDVLWIRYTTDGSTPKEWGAAVPPGYQVTVPIPGVLKAVAFKTGMNPSAVKTAEYTAAPAVATPAFDREDGAYPGGNVTVAVTCATPEATIRHTTDGGEPTEQSALVESGSTVLVPIPGMLKAKAFKAGLNPSGVRTAEYTAAPAVATPAFNPEGGEHRGRSVLVTVSCETPEATIRHTTDGSEPTEQSVLVDSGSTVTVPIPGMLKAKAFKAGLNPSGVRTAEYARAPAGPWDEDSRSLTDGWRWLRWLGAYIPLENGWYWHPAHGYFFLSRNSTADGMYIFTNDMGWLWTRTDVYPFLYRFNGAAWLWYARDTVHPRRFINLDTMMWESW